MMVPDFRDERGGVLLLVSLTLLVMLFFAALVLDVGHWKEHKRHLQLQVDAAAFAGADSLALGACNDTTVSTVAHNYAGTDATHIALYNDQVGSKFNAGGLVPNMHILLNSLGYYGQSGAGDNTGGSPCAASPPNSFCNGAQGVDVKGTETNLPWFLFGGFVPKINAHARVCLMQETSSANSLPIAVPNPKPKTAAALLVNGANNGLLGRAVLTECQNPPAPSPPTCPTATNLWSSAATSISIAQQTKVIIAISGLPASSNWWTGADVATICGQPLTTCFDSGSDPPTDGVNFIRGWSGSACGQEPAEPCLRGVQLFRTPGSCPLAALGDAYFQSLTANCSVTLAAAVDASAPAPGGGDLTGMNVTVRGANCPNQGCILTKNTTVPAPPECAAVMTGATGRCWTGLVPIKARNGAQGLTMTWQVTTGTINGKDCTKGQGCSGTFDAGAFVQQAYTADSLPTHNISGPLQFVQITSCPNPSCVAQGNSLPLGAGAPPVSVTIGLQGALRDATSVADPTASCTFDDGTTYNFACLKVTVTNAGAGSTQSVNCDPLAQPKKVLEDQLALGCTPQYILNTGTACPSANILETQPQPWNCTELFTGNKTPSVSDGLNRRIYGTQNPPPCPAYGSNGHNNWDMFNPADDTGALGFPAGDKRIVGVYLTAYGAFTHTSGTSLTIPVTDFATFYITGYDGSPCRSPLVPANQHPDDPIPDKGTITGHFIKYVDRLNTGGGTIPCDPASFGNCVPVMTK
jgi:hypothetical protein